MNDILKKFINELETGDVRVRRIAAYNLGKSKDPSAVPALIKACEDPDGTVRLNAVVALQTIGSPDAKEYLKVLPDKRKELQEIELEHLAWPVVGGLFTSKEETDRISRHRENTLKKTGSILMAKAHYVGGNPLINYSCDVIIGLSEENLTLYSFDSKNYHIEPLFSLPLIDISQIGTGRPRTAREIFDEENRRTIDVIEDSPFLHIVFKLEGFEYTMSIDEFEIYKPLEVSNRIIAMQYQARKKLSH